MTAPLQFQGGYNFFSVHFYHALKIPFENFGHIEVLFSSTYVIPSLLNQKIHPYMPVKIVKHEIDLFIDTRHFRRPKIQFWMATGMS